MDIDLSPQDKKDLDKFIKFFALKTVQIIVQARLGEKTGTCSSSSPTGSDWFNLAIKDITEVTHEAKKALAGQLPGLGRSMCVEISLKTSEGDSMELETWCLEMNEKCDKDNKVSYTVYNRLSLLLKSLLAITRVTPAYKLSRKQGHDYVILYRIYFGNVQLTGLGEGFQTVRVGIVGTPIGTITLSCAYRTNLALMSSRQFERTGPIMGIIIDHFVERPFANMAHMHPCSVRAPGEDEGGPYAGIEDSQEVCTTSFSTSPPSQCVCTVSQAHFKTPKTALMATLKVPLMGLGISQQLYSSRLSYQTPALGTVDLCHPPACTAAAHPNQMAVPGKEGGVPQVPAHPNHGTNAEHGRIQSFPSGESQQQAPPTSCISDVKRVSPSNALETTYTRKVGAFVNKATTQVTMANLDLPFAAFAPRVFDLEENDPMVHPPPSPAPLSPMQGSLHSDSSSLSGGQQHDDFVMVDFKPAFSKDDLLPMDLGTFYREFQNPPQLASLSIDVSAQSMAEDLDSLPEKLAIYEKNIDEFDAFVDTLQ
ncbi:autophagy-related protein 13 isoform X1 [Xyrauchen texanus]|uniref:autophagy-related protein 13 isoform X1 n=1 Tax=Xyrauchen texanus TaxID=154827 RepID=UPI002242BC7B|nr:autophagy-related protein 13 isoform X1 [Xyrauchen texanus]XP_051994769.1 autophagy-related protein 13 isoform X1 [Xyrauchen texanus]XP_051994776.1 autophagy-related protein 13 isoform X1 [Xyrauchen texanus]